MEYLSGLNKNFWNSNMKLLIEIVKFSELKYQISDPNINLKIQMLIFRMQVIKIQITIFNSNIIFQNLNNVF